MLTLNGKLGKTIIVQESTVKLIKKGGLFATQRDKTIPIRNISSVEVKKPGPFFVGFIQFVIPGGSVKLNSFAPDGGAVDAAKDENSVVFGDMATYEVALQIKAYIETFRESAPIIPAQQDVRPVVEDAISNLERLGLLRKNGILSEEEFAREKAKVLGNPIAEAPIRKSITQLRDKHPVPPPKTVPCPICGKGIPEKTIMQGLNTCPHCQTTYEAET